jgi:hypothetical protein
MPFFTTEDANRDGRVDLEDAVVLMRDICRLADVSSNFEREIATVIATFKAISSATVVIQSSKDSGFFKIHSDPFLKSDFPNSNYLYSVICKSQTIEKFFSFTVRPEQPPPRNYSLMKVTQKNHLI